MKKIITILVILLVVVFIICMLYFFFFNNKNKYTEKINAKIVNVIEEKISKEGRFPTTNYYYYLEVEYEINGEVIKAKCQGAQSLYNKSKIGDEIEVFYNPNNIKECALSNNK